MEFGSEGTDVGAWCLLRPVSTQDYVSVLHTSSSRFCLRSISLTAHVHVLTEIMMAFKGYADPVRFDPKQSRAGRSNLVTHSLACDICKLSWKTHKTWLL